MTAPTQSPNATTKTAPSGTDGLPTSNLAELRAQANGDAERFVIDTREKADWLLRKLAALDAEEALIGEQYQLMLARIQSDRTRLQERFLPELESFTRQEIEATGGKRKSVALFHGTVGFRTSPARLVIESEADALQTARLVLPESVTIEQVERLDKKALLAHAQTTLETSGELLPGIGQTEPTERFTIKIGGGKEN